MSSAWKTFLIYLPFMIFLMVFYWLIIEIEIQYPYIRVNEKEVLYDINYKYTTTLIPYIYNYTKEDRHSNYNTAIDIEAVKLGNSINIKVGELNYDITEMYITYEGKKIENIYKGTYQEDITEYLDKPGVYRIALYCKLHKALYYDGYVDYKFKIEVAEA